MLTLIGFTLPPDAGEKMSLRAFATLMLNDEFGTTRIVVAAIRVDTVSYPLKSLIP